MVSARPLYFQLEVGRTSRARLAVLELRVHVTVRFLWFKKNLAKFLPKGDEAPNLGSFLNLISLLHIHPITQFNCTTLRLYSLSTIISSFRIRQIVLRMEFPTVDNGAQLDSKLAGLRIAHLPSVGSK